MFLNPLNKCEMFEINDFVVHLHTRRITDKIQEVLVHRYAPDALEVNAYVVKPHLIMRVIAAETWMEVASIVRKH